MKKNIFLLLAGVLSIVIVSCDTFRTPADKFDLDSKRVSEIIKFNLDSIQIPQFFPDKDVRKYLHQEFRDFYEHREYKLAWLSFEDPHPQVADLLEAIDEADKEGLEPNSYKVDEVEKLLEKVYKIESRKERRKRLKAKKSKNEEIANEAKQQDTVKLNDLARLDFLLTSTYLTYASHLLSGKIHPDEKQLWFPERRQKRLAPYLTSAISDKKIKSSLLELAPKHIAYAKLREVLAEYKQISLDYEWKVLSPTKGLKPGKSDAIVPQLKRRLVSTGDLDEKKISAPDSAVFNEDLIVALKKFQKRHGLKETGEFDELSWKEINTPIQDKVDKIRLNLERMRWLPDSFGTKYILVNIPEYMLRIYNKDKVDLEMKVIVGKTYNATPVFSDEMQYVVFSPTWTVPKSIAVGEMLPKLREDPEYLTKKNFTLYDSWEKAAEPIDPTDVDWKDVDEENFIYRIVENPGAANALGAVKFMFPNEHDIYLHDTPTGHLFGERERSFSHGCIRVEKPLELAEYALKDKKDWNRKKIQDAMGKDEPDTVNLSEKLQVHLVYWTSWVDDDGILNFRNDIYKQDKSQIKELENKEKEMILTRKQNN